MPYKLFAMSLYMTQWRKSKKNHVELTYFINMNRKNSEEVYKYLNQRTKT